jgi:hypothetical protein
MVEPAVRGGGWRAASTAFCGVVLYLLWAAGLVGLVAPIGAARPVLAVLLAVYVVISVLRARWQTTALCVALALVSATIALVFDVWPALVGGIEKGLIFAAFLPAIILLRATAEGRPEIAAARDDFARLPRHERGAGLLLGAHVMGSMVSIGIFALLAPMLGPRADEAERKRVVGIGLRGMCTAALWSPFFVGMGLATERLPGVGLWQIMPLGLTVAALGLAISIVLFDRVRPRALGRALTSLAPVLPPVGAAGVVVVVLTMATPLSTLGAISLGLPVLCLVALAFDKPGAMKAALGATRRGLAGIGGEMSIITLAMMLGAAFEGALADSPSGWGLARLDLAPAAVIGLTTGLMIVGGIVAIHPIVSATVLLALYTSLSFAVADVVYMEAVLVGWGLGSMVSVSGISVIMAGAMVKVPPERLIRRENLAFVAILGSVAVILLTVLNDYLIA